MDVPTAHWTHQTENWNPDVHIIFSLINKWYEPVKIEHWLWHRTQVEVWSSPHYQKAPRNVGVTTLSEIYIHENNVSF